MTSDEVVDEPEPFREARERDDRDEMRRLLAEMDKGQQRRQLFNGAKHEFINVLEVFSETGMMSLDERWPSGETTPLMHAIMNGRKEAARFLVEHECSLGAKNGTGYTPLHIAASSGKDRETVFLLALAGADFETLNKENQTPLDVAGDKLRPEMRGWLMEAFRAQQEDIHARKKAAHEEFIESEAAVAHTGVVAKPMRTLRFKSPQNSFTFA
ncbi:MAG: ankyrin repeat domain-containing protein [Alphaproteobacteria bacterium]